MNAVLDMLNCQKAYYYKNLGSLTKLYASVDGEPEENSELLVTEIPLEATVYNLALFFEQVGTLFDLRLISTPYGSQNKRFCYVRYFSRVVAKKAQKMLSLKPFKGVYLTLSTTVNNSSIFVWGIPLDKTEDEVWEALIDTYGVNNIVNVLMRKNCVEPSKKRCFAILVFATYEEAVDFKLAFGKNLILFNNKLMVDWAFSHKEIALLKADFKIKSEVKILFLRNLLVSLESEQFASLVYSLIGKHAVEKVYKRKDYAFVHLRTRTQAETLMNELKNYFSNTLVEVHFAKPGDKYTDREYREKVLEQRRSNAATKKYSSTGSLSSGTDLTAYGSSPSKQFIKNEWASPGSISQEDTQSSRSASVGSLSPPMSLSSLRSDTWGFGGNSTFGWFPSAMSVMSANFCGSIATQHDESSSMRTTPNEVDDYFTIDFEDMVRKLVEDD